MSRGLQAGRIELGELAAATLAAQLAKMQKPSVLLATPAECRRASVEYMANAYEVPPLPFSALLSVKAAIQDDLPGRSFCGSTLQWSWAAAKSPARTRHADHSFSDLWE